jgi:hypothetical protein
VILTQNVENLEEMKLFFTSVLIILTTVLSAQNVAFEPAHSLLNDNAVATVGNEFFSASADMNANHNFNLKFKANPVFGDITISYNLGGDSTVRLEVEKAGTPAVALVNERQSTGNQSVLWDQDIEAGKYTIRLIVGNRVTTKTVNLAY